MDFNFRNPRAFGSDRLLAVPAFAGGRGRVKLSREEEEALKEQRHRQALALLEVARQQRSNPVTDGGLGSALGRSLGEQQIGGAGAGDAIAAGLNRRKISNAGFAGLQRNAPAVADANNHGASNGLFGGGATAAAPASAPTLSQREIANEPDPFRPADPTEGIDPNNEEAILVGDGVARIVARGGVDRICDRSGDYSSCEVRYDPDSDRTGVVSVQRAVIKGGHYVTMNSAQAPVGGSARCIASKYHPDGFCEAIPGPNTPPEEPGEIIIEEIF